MERAVIYARYSSDHQREESIDAQVRACREYCQRKGYLVTKIYADEASSLSEQKAIAERKLNNLYTVIEQGTADEYDLERLAAVKQELSQIKEKLAKCAGANSIATINPAHIEKVLKVCRKMLFKNITNESLRMLFDDLVNKITIDAKKITLQLKLECSGTYGAEGPYNTIPQKFTLTFIRPRPLTVRQQQAQKKLNPANI